MKLLYLTACRLYGPKLQEVNNTYRAAYAGKHPDVALGGPGFGVSLDVPIYLPGYIRAWCPDADVIFIADPWHNFWDPCQDYPNCPPLYTGIDEVEQAVVIESGDSQFYQRETTKHLQFLGVQRSVCVRAMSHAWRFDPKIHPGHQGRTPSIKELPPPDLITHVFYLPHGAYEEMVYASQGIAKVYDVLFSGSELAEEYPARARLAEALRSAPDLRVKWLAHPSATQEPVIGPAFWREIARSKLAVAGANAYRNLTMRYLEIPASGTLAIGDLPWPESKMDTWSEHQIDIKDLSMRDIVTEIRNHTDHPGHLAKRTNQAREFVLSRHRFSHEWHRVFTEIKSWI